MTAKPYYVRSAINGKRRKFFRFENGSWQLIDFMSLKVGDRFMFSDLDSDVRSGIFIAQKEPYHSYIQKSHMIEAEPHNEAPNKETITFQQIRDSVKNSGITPVFIEDEGGKLSALRSAAMSISGALILKIA